jgi:hypothetical protein
MQPAAIGHDPGHDLVDVTAHLVLTSDHGYRAPSIVR